MFDEQWRRQPSLQGSMDLSTGSIRDELRDVLEELSLRRNSVKDRNRMERVRRRLHYTIYSIVFLTPICLLLGAFIFLVNPAIIRLGTLQDGLDAYQLTKNIRAIGEAITEEWFASHKYLIRPSHTQYSKLHTAYNRTDELIDQSPYLSHCLALLPFPVSTKQHLKQYLQLFREDEHKIVLDVTTVYSGIISHIYECGTDTIRRIEVQKDWTRHVCYQHLLSAELHLSELKCILPIACYLKNDTFHVDKVLTLANIASSKLKLAKYFQGDNVWWVDHDSFIHDIFPRQSLSDVKFCNEMTEFSDVSFNRTQTLNERITNNDLELLSTFREKEYKGIVLCAVIASICFITGTVSVPIWVFKSSSDCRILKAKIGLISNMISEEIDHANGVVQKLIPIRYVDDTRRGISTASLQRYDSVTVIYLSIPIVKKLIAVCSPLLLVNILTSLIKLVEERISLYEVIVLQREACTYAMASGINPYCGSRHVTDVANMALDLLISCSDLELDVHPDSRVQLQMGINTGPCIGTMPNQKPLRYHLLGPTVQMAAKLEATSQLSGIHLSKTTAEMLHTQECYRLVKTGNVITLGKDFVESYWLLGRRVSCQTQDRQSDRGGSSTGSAPYPSNVELAMKPMYKYDAKKNQYLTQPQPYKSNMTSSSRFSNSTDSHTGLHANGQRDTADNLTLEHSASSMFYLNSVQHDGQVDGRVYPSGSTLSDGNNRVFKGNTTDSSEAGPSKQHS